MLRKCKCTRCVSFSIYEDWIASIKLDRIATINIYNIPEYELPLHVDTILIVVSMSIQYIYVVFFGERDYKIRFTLSFYFVRGEGGRLDNTVD